jgi:hypothetical protein
MPSKVEIKTVEELKAMHTGSLMRRREALLRCEESFEQSDRYGYEPQPIAGGDIEFKDTPEWKQAYAELKVELATREHVPNKQERKALRRQQAADRKRR